LTTAIFHARCQRKRNHRSFEFSFDFRKARR
jgi:hypothetical protein